MRDEGVVARHGNEAKARDPDVMNRTGRELTGGHVWNRSQRQCIISRERLELEPPPHVKFSHTRRRPSKSSLTHDKAFLHFMLKMPSSAPC